MAINPTELGRRIRVAREARGMTQDALARQIGVSRTAVVQMEAGNRAVSSIELDQLALALGRDMGDFFASDFAERDALIALFRLEPDLASESEVSLALSRGVALAREVRNLESLLGIDRIEMVPAAYTLPSLGNKMTAVGQGEKVAAAERRRLGLNLQPAFTLPALLESQGVQSALVELPDNVSGLTLADDKIGSFVVINSRHHLWRRRFSMAHEYGHVVMDRGRLGTVSRDENRANLIEVRANAFAAEFLLPAAGVATFVTEVGKGGPSRRSATVFDEEAEVHAESRAVPGSQDICLYDIALLADRFRVSRQSALYRLKNLRLINNAQFRQLKDQERASDMHAVSDFLGLHEPDHQKERAKFGRHFLGLALDAFRLEKITQSKLYELGAMVKISSEQVDSMITAAGIAGDSLDTAR